MFDDAVPFGIRLATPYYEESETPGEPPRLVTYLLNPPGDQVIEDGDEVIVTPTLTLALRDSKEAQLLLLSLCLKNLVKQSQFPNPSPA